MKVLCEICKKELDVKPYRIKRLKRKAITCSKICFSELQKTAMKGNNNHQFGLIGSKNASFKNIETISNYGYILEYCEGHPRPHDKSVQGTRVKQHRLVVERNSHLFDSKYFEVISGMTVLRQEYDVHHINEIITDNDINNLEILTRSEHTVLHNKSKQIIRDTNTGRIIGVFKLDELLENPEEDNQQPS